MRTLAAWLAPLVVLFAGCVGDEQTVLVSPSPFRDPATPPAVRVQHGPPNQELAQRLSTIGVKIITANPQLGIRPFFQAIGTPDVELFHNSTSQVFMTEGLARQCQTEGQFAALLAFEFGRMIAEREATRSTTDPEPLPPLETPVGNEVRGSFGAVDGMHMYEMTRYEQKRNRAREAKLPLDPRMLAKTYLTKAGYEPTEIDAVAPLLSRVETSGGGFERQLTQPARQPAR
jgi:hypothetical protein